MKTRNLRKLRRAGARTMALTLVLCVLGTCVFGVPGSEVRAASGFSDVKASDWFKPFVTELADGGVISGYPDGTFRPSNQVTVGQFLSMAVQAGERSGVIESIDDMAIGHGEAGRGQTVEVQTTTSNMTVKSHWAQPFYDAAQAENLIFSDELPKTSLDQPIPRLWMAVITSRIMALESGGGSAISSVDFEKALDQITDVEELQPYSYEIGTAYAKGLLSGYPDGTFRSEGYLTRAEAATVIYKLDRILASEAAPTEPAEPQDPPAPAPTDSTPDLEPAEPPAFGFEQDPAEMSVGTKLFWCRIGEAGLGDADVVRTQNLTAVRDVMKEQVPDLAEQLYESFEGFAKRAVIQQAQGKQGLRKEYVGGFPVLMEAVGGEVRVYVKPKGSETRFWGVEPGQVSEEFF